MPAVISESGAVSGTVTHLSDVITSDMMNGVFSEILGVLPVVVPAIVGFIAIRKGLSFVLGALRKA